MVHLPLTPRRQYWRILHRLPERRLAIGVLSILLKARSPQVPENLDCFVADPQPPNDLDPCMTKDLVAVGRVRQLGCQILSGKMQLFMEPCTPPRAACDIINDAIARDPDWRPTLAGISLEFPVCHQPIRIWHFCLSVNWWHLRPPSRAGVP